MSLRSCQLASVYDTSTNDVVRDFFIPALKASVSYDRGVGYFSSGFLRTVADGLTEFAGNEGRIRLIASPILDEADWEALNVGEQARWDLALRKILQRDIENLAKSLAADTLSALAWMVADGILTFKVALPVNKLDGGEFHTKFGIFTDIDGNRVSFEGSNNETVRGTLSNYEKFKVFCSWEPVLAALVEADVDTFERLWTGGDPNVRVFELSEATKQQILKLRTGERPYTEPSWVEAARAARERRQGYQPPRPLIPDTIELRDYQNEAINSWIANQYHGLFEMATGTGKTITALAASARLFDETQRLAVVITVPYQHLVDQWQAEAAQFGYRPILAYQRKSKWLNPLNHEIIDFNGGYSNFISVITTHTTFIDPDFQGTLQRLKGQVLIIADEAHHLGAENSRKHYPNQIPYRLALSATPDRWFDDVGTAALRQYFGDTIFEFGLDKAIGHSLTPYYYYPHLVELMDSEMEEYEDLSAKIARMMGRDDDEGQTVLKNLLIRRANLLNNAQNKLVTIGELVDQSKVVNHTLFYCAPGQIDQVVHLLGWEKGVWLNRFTAEEDAKERQRLLADFAKGDVQALVAMKCLDEGVDVPSTEIAYFLASSSNPREFVQRRGRILRKSPGKTASIIHDLIAVPPKPVDVTSPSFNAERGIMRRELQRFKEFADLALNKHEAVDVIWELAKHYSLMDF